MKEIIHLYHMNDWHSHLENWPRIQRYYEYQKHQHIKDGEAVFLFDIGDACDRQHPLTEATDGQANIELLNQIGVDAATIGNNEGIGNPHQTLEHLYDHADFPVLLGNLVDKHSGLLPAFAQPYTMFQTERGIRMAVFGMTAPFEVSYNIVGWKPLDPIQSIENVLSTIKMNETFDLILFLSHLGLPDDRAVAERFPDIDVIFGAHTHHVLPEGERVGNTLLTGGGKYGQFIGHVAIEIDKNIETGNIQQKTTAAELIESDRISGYPEDNEQAEWWEKQGNYLLTKQVIGNLTFDLPNHEFYPSELQYFVLKAITEETQADMAILNSGLFLAPLTKGAVSRYDLHQSIPHPMRLMEISATGAEIKRIVTEMLALQAELTELPVSGMGFRGHVFGTLASYPENMLTGLRTLNDAKLYKLITVDHLIFLPFFTQMKGSSHKLWGPQFLREVVAKYIAGKYKKPDYQGEHYEGSDDNRC